MEIKKYETKGRCPFCKNDRFHEFCITREDVNILTKCCCCKCNRAFQLVYEPTQFRIPRKITNENKA